LKHCSLRTAFLALGVIIPISCQPIEQVPVTKYAYQSIDTAVSSRGISIPATYVEPTATGDETFPLVVMAHGHGGSRHEEGSFTQVAERLATLGVASIRMDFSGCGESSESFANNNLSNMLSDFLAAHDFAIGRSHIDKERVGLFGWSMGGRLVLLLGARNDDFKVIATWSPAASNGAGSMVSFLGGQSAYDELKGRALERGSATFTTLWGQNQELGLQWFEDLEDSRPLESISAFEGPLLILYGDLDDVVLPSVSELVIQSATRSIDVVRHIVEDADHGLGVFSGNHELTEEAIATTVEFLSKRL
jgi:dienelactone hydrolase